MFVENMESRDKNLSLQFYKYVCNIVGSEEVVRTRREIFTLRDISDSFAFGNATSSGSKAEGLDLKGSDYDQMMQVKYIRVYESLNDVQSYQDKIPLVMVNNDTKPGFTKIRLVSNSHLDVIHQWCATLGEETYISSKLFREHYLNSFDDLVVHGPCLSTSNGEVDAAFCLRCNEWITPAQQWIHRSRKTWPHPTLVTAAVQYGVLFVPIGCKNSPNEDLQWRISFSVTEKLLIHSFSHTQLLCYALMKMVLKDLIKPRHGDLLCSYFIKTIMFWLSEEISPSEWKPENMISCFLDCIRRLIYCVEYKTCLHYFIPENNLFEYRFIDKEHMELLNTLRFIYVSPWISVFETSTFHNYRLQSVNSRGMILLASELSCYCYLHRSLSSSIYTAITRLKNVCLTEELITFTLSVYAEEVLKSSEHCNMMARNKLFYQQYKRTLFYLKISLRSSSISTWLLQASLFYNCKRFHECLDIINYCLFSSNPDKIHLKYANSLADQTVFNQIKQKWGLLYAFKYLMIEPVRFRYPFYLLPHELKPLKVDEYCSIPPVVYSYLLQFLCCHQLGYNRGKHDALHDLELTVRNQYLIMPIKFTFRNIYKSLEIVRSLI
ncbi:Hypothetical predicted protein [Mytilus galloprovincialis]|uniref:Mab-21-like HhH/H2TH-like domain-containing protein n=1 Tax=Mytilus galloprovincialis TaxID=29158 RepID=A0A8B6C9J3_MYTGA|nr:Hypothetical predicted protein [Mytilus galloprovincialis]